jgi:hypothetical protein
VTRPRDALIADLERARDRHPRPSPDYTGVLWRTYHRAIRAMTEAWWYLDAGHETHPRQLIADTARELIAIGAEPALIERVKIARQIPANGDSP